MKKIATTLALSLAVFSASSFASDEFNADVRLTVGQTGGDIRVLSEGDAVAFETEIDSIGLAVRNHFNDNWAFELKYTMEGDEIVPVEGYDDVNFDANSSLFVSGIYKQHLDVPILPYVKVGLGVFNSSLNSLKIKDSTYVLGVGVDYSASEHVVVGVEYERYGSIDFDSAVGDIEFDRVSVNIGFQF